MRPDPKYGWAVFALKLPIFKGFRMHAITSIGEIGITVGDREILLRPSFQAMSSLGTPEEIVQLFADVMEPSPSRYLPPWQYKKAVAAHWRRSTWASYSVISACASEDISDLLGTMGLRYGTFRPGLIPTDHFVPLAASLMKHGVVGVIPKERPEKSDDDDDEYTPGFDARKFVALATVHLGMSEGEAWRMTMTSFTLAMQAKFGKPDKKKPSAKKLDDAMAFLDRVNARRERDKKNV